MSLLPEMEAKGMKAYEQVRAFERLRTWRLPLAYGVFVSIPALTGVAMWEYGFEQPSELTFCFAVGFAVVSWFHWRQLKAIYAANLKLLADLDALHGELLPWRQVEKHLAELEQLKRELADEG